MFIRTKKRVNKSGNSYEYAYLVHERWRYKKPKQTIKKYLGRVYKFDTINNKSLQEFLNKKIEEYIKNTKTQEIFLDLIRFELSKLGFKEQENIIKNDHLMFNLKNYKLLNNKNKSSVIDINQGYLTELTIKNLINFRLPNKIDRECGKELANCLVSAGISINNELFISLFNKLIDKE